MIKLANLKQELFTVKEIAGYLRYSDQTIRNLVNSGELKGAIKRDGCAMRIPEASINEYLERNTWEGQNNQQDLYGFPESQIGTSEKAAKSIQRQRKIAKVRNNG